MICYDKIFQFFLCWTCGHRRPNLAFPCASSRIRRCSQFPGSMQLATAGSWTRMHVCSRNGPFTQVRMLQILKQNVLLFFGWEKYQTKLNDFCRKIHRGPNLWPKDVEGQLPLCNELPAWHPGGERQERQQGPPSYACLQDAARHFKI